MFEKLLVYKVKDFLGHQPIRKKNLSKPSLSYICEDNAKMGKISYSGSIKQDVDGEGVDLRPGGSTAAPSL